VIAENGLWFCDKCKSLLVEHESWFVEIASEHLCVCCAENEIVGLRDQLRWRKWPEEKPEVEQQCQLILANKLAPILCCSKYPFDHWENLNATYWRPIGPLPKETE
jgi:hypothetical protein